jgi:hypothetical protein
MSNLPKWAEFLISGVGIVSFILGISYFNNWIRLNKDEGHKDSK